VDGSSQAGIHGMDRMELREISAPRCSHAIGNPRSDGGYPHPAHRPPAPKGRPSKHGAEQSEKDTRSLPFASTNELRSY
jgi:hypothetical protein